MKRGRRSRSFRRTSAGKNLIWITSVTAVAVTDVNAPSGFVAQNLILPSDWQDLAAFDRCTLMRVRGWLSCVQQGAATAANVTGLYAAIHLQDTGVAAASNPAISTFYDAHDTIWTGGMGLTTAVAATVFQPSLFASQLDIKAKRRMTTQQDLNLTFALPADAATPAVNVNAVIRCLLQTD